MDGSELRIVILPVGEVEGRVLGAVRDELPKVFPGSLCCVSEDVLEVPREAYNASRRQYVSTRILSDVLSYAKKVGAAGDGVYRVLGVVDVDLYVPGLNFVFGEAWCPGKAALISLFRLRPEFYGAASDERLFIERAVKEAVHEVGHTLGLRHCGNPACGMRFSLHIEMTDRKRAGFCKTCRQKAERIS
ncbi:MAG: archaemetzincin family Zn-dependent metalloprotease [Candidatus Bathyarchaeota archaeon]|nr:archaemetzincin family Zn-dependent metalloprotease [Candidatus Bathyarchaeota archaeon]